MNTDLSGTSWLKRPLHLRRAPLLERSSKPQSLWVDSVSALVGLQRYAGEIDKLNEASARHNPFLSSAFLLCYAQHSEYHEPDSEARLLLIRKGDRLIGCAPMRRSLDRFGPRLGPVAMRAARWHLLAARDTDRPGLLCASEDEAVVATALLDDICTHDRGWGMLELEGQRPGGALHAAVHAAGHGSFRARDIAVEPYFEIPLQGADLAGYFRSLSRNMRHGVSRQVRRLFAAGDPEIVLADGAAAVSAWFDAYCELDARSWKRGTAASISRNPRRMKFYRELIATAAGLEPSFIGVMLRGALIAGMIVGSSPRSAPIALAARGTWCLETAYDPSYSQLGPGQLLLLLAIDQALRRGDSRVNLLQNFGYYKRRWGAEPIAAVSAQLLRRFSAHNARGSLGDLRRRWQSRSAVAEPTSASESQTSRREPDTPSRRDTRAADLALEAMAFDGPGVQRLRRAGLREHLPFDLD